MSSLVFVTDGKIDLRSFTTFGFNAKPNSQNPIGFFGTGLKISTAVLARLGCKMTVIIDGVHHEFYTKSTDFRGKSFDVVRMRKRKGLASRWQYQEMPYTTELGKNWEPWQVFRELESNTRDENGYTMLVEEGDTFLDDDDYHRGKTIIVVDEPSVIEAYEERETIFLPDDLEMRYENGRCEAFNVKSDYLFYRGMRVMKLDKPSNFTYNILSEQRLTEDRTLYDWNAQWEIRKLIMESEDDQFIEEVLSVDEDEFWEGRIDFDSAYSIPGPRFHSVLTKAKALGIDILPRAQTFFNKYYVPEPEDPDVTITLARSKWESIGRLMELVEKDCVNLYNELGWEDGDENVVAFESFLDYLGDKAPHKPESEPEDVEVEDEEIPF